MAKRNTTTSEAVAAFGEALSEYLPGGRRRAAERNSAADAVAFTAGLLSGALVAGVAAIFLAPTDGRALRARLADRINGLLGYDLLPPAASTATARPVDTDGMTTGGPGTGVVPEAPSPQVNR